MSKPNVLVFDIETSPAKVYTWSLYKPIIGINQIIDHGRVLGFGWMWHGEKSPHWAGEDAYSHEQMIQLAHGLLTDADIVVGWNSKQFDVRHLNREFKSLGMPLPAPFHQVDLMRVAKKQFYQLSYKLDYTAQFFGDGAKQTHEGFGLWEGCMAGDPKSWKKMASYCKQDVRITDRLYGDLLPYIPGHPNLNLILDSETPICPSCGSLELRREGYRLTQVGKYQRYQCRDCGSWSSAGRAQGTTQIRSVA